MVTCLKLGEVNDSRNPLSSRIDGALGIIAPIQILQQPECGHRGPRAVLVVPTPDVHIALKIWIRHSNVWIVNVCPGLDWSR